MSFWKKNTKIAEQELFSDEGNVFSYETRHTRSVQNIANTDQPAVVKKPDALVLQVGRSYSGRIQTPRSIKIVGTFQGDLVSAGEIYIGPGAIVEGKLEAKAVIVEGRFKGTLKAEQMISIAAQGEVEGNLYCAKVNLREGGYLRGSCFIGGISLVAA